MVITPEERYVRWRTTALVVWAAIGILVLVAAAVWGLERISAALAPFVVGFVLVFLLNWPVRALVARGMKRSHAATLCLTLLLVVIGGLLVLLGPRVAHQLSSFVSTAPRYLERIQVAEERVETQLSALVLPTWLAGMVRNASAQLGQFVVALGNNAAHLALNAGGSIARGLLDVFLAFIIAFWVLVDLPKLREEITKVAGPKYEADTEHLLATVTRVVGGYLRGQTIASLTTATISTTGLLIFHVPYALVLGVLAFFFNFAPYVGPVTTGLIAGMLGILVSPQTAIAAVASVIVAQTITDYVVVPRVMSSQVDLHPTLVIFSLLVGGTLFGIAGLLFAIPVAAVGKGLFVYYYERRTERSLATSDGALFRNRTARHTPARSAQDDAESAPSAPENAE